jgi:hypothetical protein
MKVPRKQLISSWLRGSSVAMSRKILSASISSRASFRRCIARSVASARAHRRLRRPRRRPQSRSGDRCSTTMSSASSADIAAGCSAGISASPMGLNPRSIVSAGGCHLITRSLRRPIRSGVRQWQSRSVLVTNRRKPSCRLPKWSQGPHSGVAANRDRQPRSSSYSAAPPGERQKSSGSDLYPAAPIYRII